MLKFPEWAEERPFAAALLMGGRAFAVSLAWMLFTLILGADRRLFTLLGIPVAVAAIFTLLAYLQIKRGTNSGFQ